MSERALSPTSYIVLGLLSQAPGTPYDLKARVAATIGDFWSVQHAQLYTETARLAQEGLLDERREETGRRRRVYSITKTGRKALRQWLAGPVHELAELRDLALLKVFFGADPQMIAAAQVDAHRAQLARYEQLDQTLGDADVSEGLRLALQVGLMHEREFVAFWEALAEAT
jgi:PadR family transcriptional regulator, regulatory protein AphA